MSERGEQEADPEHATHLTVHLERGVQKNEDHNYSREGRHTRKAVDLPKGTIRPWISQKPGIKKRGRSSSTNPNRSLLGNTPLNDIPLKIEGSEELPT